MQYCVVCVNYQVNALVCYMFCIKKCNLIVYGLTF